MGVKIWVLAVAAAMPLLPSEFERARAQYERTEYAAALATLRGSGEEQSAGGLELSGKAHYQLGDFRKAIERFEKAEAAAPRSARIKNWLGRSWGRVAEAANPLMAPGHAVKARKYFEAAVELDPRDREAVSDLLSYYLEAPGFLGGGLDKAAQLAERIRTSDPEEHHAVLGQIAERRKEYERAEGELRKAISLAMKPAGRIVELAKFLARRGRLSEAEQQFQRAAKEDPGYRPLLYERARVYIENKRELDKARKLLEEYMKGPLTPDDPSREEARRLLARTGASAI
jgi:tetratricopeptide (TPR) repeat protein